MTSGPLNATRHRLPVRTCAGLHPAPPLTPRRPRPGAALDPAPPSTPRRPCPAPSASVLLVGCCPSPPRRPRASVRSTPPGGTVTSPHARPHVRVGADGPPSRALPRPLAAPAGLWPRRCPRPAHRPTVSTVPRSAQSVKPCAVPPLPLPATVFGRCSSVWTLLPRGPSPSHQGAKPAGHSLGQLSLQGPPPAILSP